MLFLWLAAIVEMTISKQSGTNRISADHIKYIDSPRFCSVDFLQALVDSWLTIFDLPEVLLYRSHPISSVKHFTWNKWDKSTFYGACPPFLQKSTIHAGTGSAIDGFIRSDLRRCSRTHGMSCVAKRSCTTSRRGRMPPIQTTVLGSRSAPSGSGCERRSWWTRPCLKICPKKYMSFASGWYGLLKLLSQVSLSRTDDHCR